MRGERTRMRERERATSIWGADIKEYTTAGKFISQSINSVIQMSV